MNNNTKILGFDLGHGETALTWVRADNQDTTPQCLLINNRKSQTTAIANHPQRGFIIGDKALLVANSITFEIAFKSRRFDNKAYQKILKEFVNALFLQLLNNKQIQSEDENLFFVGCPSGWWPGEIAIYEQLLSECLQNVIVVKESRAALMHAKESGIFTLQQLSKSVLVIDIGSSTTDYSLIKGTSDTPIEDFGYDLGASLIDKAILRKTIDCHREYRQGKESNFHLGEYLTDAEIWQLEEIIQLEKIFAENLLYKNRCELRCRKAKEEYFNNYDADEDYLINVGSENIQRKFTFTPLVNRKIMDAIINEPLPELDNKSWHDTFHDQLQTVKAKLTAKGIESSSILLTGSASKMYFIQDICSSVFTDLPSQRDTEPELCIAKGLTRWGRVYFRTESFTKEINQFLDRELAGIVGSRIPAFVENLAVELANGLADEVIKPSIESWQDGNIFTLKALESEIEVKAKSWLTVNNGNQKITGFLEEWLSQIQIEVWGKTDSICRKYGLPLSTLGSKLTDFGDQTGKVLIPIAVKDFTGFSLFAEHLAADLVADVLPAVLFDILPFTRVISPIIELIDNFINELWIRDTDIPGWIRNFVSEKRIDNLVETKKTEFQQKILETLTKDPTIAIKLSNSISKWLKESVQEQADKARLLIA